MACCATNILPSGEDAQALARGLREANTFDDLICLAREFGRYLAREAVQAELHRRAQDLESLGECPQCGTRLESKGWRGRNLVTSLGSLAWRSREGRCPHRCEIGRVLPVERSLGLQPAQRTSDELKRAACALAVFVPYEASSSLFKVVGGVQVSDAAIWEWVQQAGSHARQCEQRQVAAMTEGQMPAVELASEATSLPAALGADGVLVPFRPHSGTAKGGVVWREVKVAVITRLAQWVSRRGTAYTTLVWRRLVAVLGTTDDLLPRLELEAYRQRVHEAPQVTWVSDGGRGLWSMFAASSLARVATPVLDFFHAAENLFKGALVWFAAEPSRCHAWFDQARHRLRHGQQGTVLDEVAAAARDAELPEEARRVLRNLAHYLHTHGDHLDYARFKALGIPLGSGMVESACKWLIQQRFKGVGMRWSPEGFMHLLYLRLAWVNGRFSDLDFSPT